MNTLFILPRYKVVPPPEPEPDPKFDDNIVTGEERSVICTSIQTIPFTSQDNETVTKIPSPYDDTKIESAQDAERGNNTVSGIGKTRNTEREFSNRCLDILITSTQDEDSRSSCIFSPLNVIFLFWFSSLHVSFQFFLASFNIRVTKIVNGDLEKGGRQ